MLVKNAHPSVYAVSQIYIECGVPLKLRLFDGKFLPGEVVDKFKFRAGNDLASASVKIAERSGALLNELPDMEVIAESGDGREALRLIGEKKPDLALIDISMPGLNGLELAARAGKEYPSTRIVILSMHVDDEFVRRAKDKLSMK